MLAKKLNIGDTIGVVAPSNPIVGDNVEQLERARRIVEVALKLNFQKIYFLILMDTVVHQEKKQKI